MEVSLYSTGNFHFKFGLDRACVRVHSPCICHVCFVPALDKLVEKSRHAKSSGFWEENLKYRLAEEAGVFSFRAE